MPLRAGTIIAAVLAREALVKSKRASVLFRFTWIVLIAFHSSAGWSDAAEIKCASKWGWLAKAEHVSTEEFPSHRQPSSDTCNALLIEGEIALGDAVEGIPAWPTYSAAEVHRGGNREDRGR